MVVEDAFAVEGLAAVAVEERHKIKTGHNIHGPRNDNANNSASTAAVVVMLG